MVKRVVGLPGEEVEISNGDLYVNGALVSEAHPMKRGSLAVGKGKLFPGKLAILGDNRALPPAQMVHAVVAREEIVGKVILTIRGWRRLSRLVN